MIELKGFFLYLLLKSFTVVAVGFFVLLSAGGCCTLSMLNAVVVMVRAAAN